ncbi:unnamed protein product [Arctia plantaginis]|uniref:Cuticle protein n=1 Tax=Arctia plantaginis TaxID=874455 RepID=A0A8S0ZJV6_ARCPL|nr:unnamed protein product [Arctia plantaginis]
MAFKLVVLSCLLALVHGSAVPAAIAAAPVAYAAPAVAARLEEFDPLPQYRFGYDVADSLTGDYKSQTEQRNGDLVQGQYSLVDSDGTRRVVDYTADSINGFNAVVRKEPLVAAAPAVVAEPAVVPARYAAAPIVAQPAAPVVARYAAAPVAAAPVVAARYASAPVATPVVAARYATAPVAAPVVAAQYATAPVAARYDTAPIAAPVVAARYAAAPVAYAQYAPYVARSVPVAAAYRAAYTASVAPAYSAPVVVGNIEEQLDRHQEINAAMERAILQDLQQLLHEHHALVRLFKSALERMPNNDYKVVIWNTRTHRERNKGITQLTTM